MWQLARHEWLRFRRPTAAMGLAHLVILSALAALGSLFVPASLRIDSGLLAYGLPMYSGLGVVIGLVQARAYRSPTMWAYLLHRPLPPSRIFLAVGAAGTASIVIAVGMPLLAVTAGLDILSFQWIDTRMYGMSALVVLIATSGYLIGWVLALVPGYAALATLLLPVLYLAGVGAGWWILVLVLATIAWAGILACIRFQPDRTVRPHGALGLALGALPLQYLLLWSLSLAGLLVYTGNVIVKEYGVNWRGLLAHGWDDYFDDDTFARASYLHGGEALAHALDLAPEAQRQSLRDHVDLESVLELQPRWIEWPRRHQAMSMDRQQVLDDPNHDRRFLFSHDRMRFQGWHLRSLAGAGWLGPRGMLPQRAQNDDGYLASADRFPDVPIVDGAQVITPRQISRFDAQRTLFDLQFEGQEDERFVTPLVAQRRFAAVLSDRRVYVFAEPAAAFGPLSAAGHRQLTPAATVALPGAVRNLAKVLVAPLNEGFIVSFLFGTLSERDQLPARQVIVEIDDDGATDVLDDRALRPGPPAWSRHWDFIMSPVLTVTRDAVRAATARSTRKPARLVDVVPRAMPTRVLGLAAAAALLSALFSIWWVRPRVAADAPRWPWILVAACGGVPGALSVCLLLPRREVPMAADS